MFKRFFRAEEGSVTVFVAVAMTVLLGFSALAVDYGSLTNERSLLQNAADAAALAGVVKENESEAIATAKDYVLKNTTGVSEGDIQVIPSTDTSTDPATDTLQVTIKKECPAFFSQVLTGDTSNQVAASATAKHGGKVVKPEYAIWAENEIELKNNANIEGKIHSNTVNEDGQGNFDFKAHVDIPEENKTAGGQIMPDYSYLKDYAVPFPRSDLKKSTEITSADLSKFDEGLIYIIDDGQDITIKKNTPLKFSLISNGRIIFLGNGAGVDAKILYSTYDSIANGQPAIELNGGSGSLRVLAYAPNGTITWNGHGTTLFGAIIAQNFIENGSSIEVKFDENILGDYPRLVPHLIK